VPKVRVNDVEIYYEEFGKGRPMVFLSETACDGEVWKIYQVQEFSKDHRVIIHDYRGTGQSGNRRSTTRPKCSPRMWWC
jgi:pimeloyl-ACP methyl ester carboxylesterase